MTASEHPLVADMSHTPPNNRDGIRATGRLLVSLLVQRGPYRRRWEQRLGRGLPDGALNKSAVAKVIAAHLWDTGERSDTETALPRQIKDRVYRALSGELISAETLTWFADAFDMTGTDRERLRALRFPDMPGSGGPVVDSLRHPQFVPISQRHRTIAVFERRMIGPAGTVVGHQTTSAILACEDGVTSYPYRLVRGARAVRVRRGGRVTARHEFPKAAPVLEITLNTPLRRGQVASLEYDVEFTPQAHRSCEYRRVAHSRCENVNIIVQFTPARRPAQLWWTVWDDYRDGEVLYEEPALLDVEACAHHFVPYMENAAAGFRWTW